MLHFLATFLNELGNTAENNGTHTAARVLYRSAALVRPRWSSPWYNLGLQAKYRCEWEASLRFNERAAELDPDDEASWWNMGIAATALQDWVRARKAWKGCGIELEEAPDGISMPPVTACVRLDPNDSGEVVWGTRIDPARIQIRNVPLPNSNRRYRDIVLNDGAPAGNRKSGEYEYPVFDELALWQPSPFSTFRSELTMPDSNSGEELLTLCHEREVGVEDWSTIRILCAECSKGSPDSHPCSASRATEGESDFGFAAISREVLMDVLSAWAEQAAGRGFSVPRLVLIAQ